MERIINRPVESAQFHTSRTQSFNRAWPRLVAALAALALAGGRIALGSSADLELDTNASKIEVAVKATGDSFVASLQSYQATIALDPETLRPGQAVFSWDFQELKTGKAKRDKAMLDWLEHNKIPKATFTLKSWEPGEGKGVAVGDLDLHGVKKEIRMPVTVTREGQTIRIQGDADLDYRNHQLKVITFMLMFKVNPILKVHFELVGHLRPQAP